MTSNFKTIKVTSGCEWMNKGYEKTNLVDVVSVLKHLKLSEICILAGVRKRPQRKIN